MVRTTLTCLILLVACSVVNAQRVDINRAYGQGVHAYNNGDYKLAVTNLSLAIENGSSDPRTYYFRGFAQSMLQNETQALSDFEKGAELEFRGGYSSQINRSLQRVQGTMRLALEKVRSGGGSSKAINPVTVGKTRINVSGKTPFASEIKPGSSGFSPNLPDPNKSTDPTSPFPNLSGKLVEPVKTDEIIEGDLVGTKDLVTPNDVEPKTEDPIPTPADEKSPDAVMKDPFGAKIPATEDKPKVDETPKVDPFGGELPKAEDKPATDPFGSKPATEDKPKVDDTPKAEDKPATDPFGSKPATEDKPKVDVTPKAKDKPATDPFGSKPATEDKPKSNDEPKEEPAKKAPVKEDPKSDAKGDGTKDKPADDPFATPPKKDDAKSEGTKDKPADDPFGKPPKKDGKKSGDPFDK